MSNRPASERLVSLLLVTLPRSHYFVLGVTLLIPRTDPTGGEPEVGRRLGAFLRGARLHLRRGALRESFQRLHGRVRGLAPSEVCCR